MRLIFQKLKVHKSKSKVAFIIVCILPALLLYLLFKIYPLITMGVQSFQTFTSVFGDKVFAGFHNYVAIFNSSLFWQSVWVTLFFIIVTTIITIVFALLFATILAKSKAKGKTFFRVLFYFPNILSVVIIGGIFNGIFNINGILNAILGWFNLSGTAWYAHATWAKWCVLVAMVWQAVGYYMVMYIAGMDSIPDSLYESAKLDGAGAATQFFKITIPMLWEIIRTTLTFFIISTINLAFLFVVTMMGSEISLADTTLNYMQKLYDSSQYGTAMAVGVFLFVTTFALSLIIQRVTRREIIEAQ